MVVDRQVPASSTTSTRHLRRASLKLNKIDLGLHTILGPPLAAILHTLHNTQWWFEGKKEARVGDCLDEPRSTLVLPLLEPCGLPRAAHNSSSGPLVHIVGAKAARCLGPVVDGPSDAIVATGHSENSHRHRELCSRGDLVPKAVR